MCDHLTRRLPRCLMGSFPLVDRRSILGVDPGSILEDRSGVDSGDRSGVILLRASGQTGFPALILLRASGQTGF